MVDAFVKEMRGQTNIEPNLIRFSVRMARPSGQFDWAVAS